MFIPTSSKPYYSGTLPHGDFGLNTVTLLLQPLFSGPAKTAINFCLTTPC